MTLLDFQCLSATIFAPPHFASKVSYSASPQASAKCPRGAPCSDATLAMLFALKTAQIFFWILNTQPNAASTPCPIQGRPHLSKPQTYPPFFAFPTGACCQKRNSPFRPLYQSANHAPDADAPRPRCGRVSTQMRTYHVPDAVVSRPRRADKSYFPRILDNQPIDIIKMEDLSRNYRETCREPPRQKKSPHDSQIVIAISIGIAMLLADCSSAKPVFSPDNITIFAILVGNTKLSINFASLTPKTNLTQTHSVKHYH